MINQFQIGGYLMETPEVKTSNAGNSYCECRIDTKRKGRDGNTGPNVLTITAFKENADLLGQLSPGEYVALTGKIEDDSFETKEGKPIARFKLLAFSAASIQTNPAPSPQAQGVATHDAAEDPFADQ